MASISKPHAVCIPVPAQGHMTPMLALAKLLHSSGFHITFVNTEFNHRRLLRSHNGDLGSFPDFQFMTIPDGLPDSDDVSTRETNISQSINHEELPPALATVTYIISDASMSFALDAANEIGIPCALFRFCSACAFMAYLHYGKLLDKGLFPLKDAAQLHNGFLDTAVDWVPGLNHMRLKDFPSFIRTTDRNDIMFNFITHEMDRAPMASAIILNTFDELEQEVLTAMAAILPPIYTIGPLPMLSEQVPVSPIKSLSLNLWKEQSDCLNWLEGKRNQSVVYVNFGSLATVTNEQLTEFAWGLANSGYAFMWIIRPDLVKGDNAKLPLEFLEATKDRSLILSWCQQETVLRHPAVGVFLTHSGWNSTLESICGGVPMLCWPFFADQQTNCRYVCAEWGIGMEVDNDVKREEVQSLIREMMDGEKGKEMKRRVVTWKEKAVRATQPDGSSYVNLKRLINEVLVHKRSA
ncbi:UDP-glycosyltransferase 85A2-like protein [Carex littledalei]|uniref:Glycosyltransferase n=1 Tax=Carex littledalei TaxID=544730 RepID=A0A833R575_9POAL|nr:UDP-glycosyltransferase 85A2-like protein [Carex littledalei]